MSNASPPLTNQQINTAAASARAKYDLAFQVSPIVLAGGIAASAPGGLLPIIALYGQLPAFNNVNGATNPDEFFARYVPLAGSQLISNQASTYPFANQQVAANSLIQNPLAISMRMIAPVNQTGGYTTKLATFTALQQSLQQHCAAGGWFSVATPAFIYNNVLLLNMNDITEGTRQQQIEYQLDFSQPLLTIQAAAAAENALINRYTSGAKIKGVPQWSGDVQAAGTGINGLSAAISQFGGSLAPAAGLPANALVAFG